MMKDTEIMDLLRDKKIRKTVELLIHQLDKQNHNKDTAENEKEKEAEQALKLEEKEFSSIKDGDFSCITSKEDFLNQNLYMTLFSVENELTRTSIKLKLGDLALRFNSKRKFEELCRAKEREIKAQSCKDSTAYLEKQYTETAFTDLPEGIENLPTFNCSATDDGVYVIDPKTGTKSRACSHPIIPVRILQNKTSGIEKIFIAYKVGSRWQTTIVDRSEISNTMKIVGLSSYGVSVTSLNAAALVRYFQDTLDEARKKDKISTILTTSKLGWCGEEFVPYVDKIVFDGYNDFPHLLDSLSPKGDKAIWYQTFRSLRAERSIVIQAALVAACSAVFLSYVGLSEGFIVDFYGESGMGKSVLATLAASIFADCITHPNAFMRTFRQTDVSLEAICDTYNSLPIFCDDSNNMDSKFKREKIESFAYLIANGRGKSRGSKSGGLQRERNWCTVGITTSEDQLSSLVDHAGAKNRILEVCVDHKLFEHHDIGALLELIGANCGWAGRDFVNLLRTKSRDALKALVSAKAKEISAVVGQTGSGRQILPLAVMLAVDELIARELFGDEIFISVEDAVRWMHTAVEVDHYQAFYDKVCDDPVMNKGMYVGGTTDIDYARGVWGRIENGGKSVSYIPGRLKDLAHANNLSLPQFVSWLKKKHLLSTVAGGKRDTVSVRLTNDMTRYCYRIMMPDDIDRTDTTDNPFFDPGDEPLPF